MMTDLAFRVPTTRILESRFKGGARAYNYVFNWPAPVANNGLGACHAMDVPYVFGTYGDKSLGGIFGGGEDAKLISQSMQRTWTRFARYGAPDVEYEWPAYDHKNRNTMVVGYDAGIQSNMWRELDPAWYRVTMEMLRRY